MQYIGKVLKNTEIAEKIWRMDIGAGKKFKSLPGQFINVLVSPSYEPLLRRPFSIFETAEKKLAIVYKVIGEGTKAMSLKKKGDELDFIGPLGGSYLDFMQLAAGKNIIIIGGGTGAASTYYLAKYLRSKKISFTFIQGARCASQMVAPREFKKLGCLFTTDDGTLGKKGFVSSLLKKEISDDSVIFACGPKPMFRAIAGACAQNTGVKIFASFEEYMGCGIGACLSCAVETKAGIYKRVCKDGPVFDIDELAL